MVPLKLSLRNFMAYRSLDPPLDFSSIHVACLSGPNGAGKSALLDAMTWALWGQARARSDDDLHNLAAVRMGENDLEVELEFALGEDRYRVIRKHALPRPRLSSRRKSASPRVKKVSGGTTILELQVADADGGFRPITGNTLRETQRQIEGLLRMDYQTFINSALLLQGRADEFTLKAPGERKRVLSEVLGLSRYDEYEERARSEARRLEGELSSLRAETAALEAEVSLSPQFEAELRETQGSYEQLLAQAKAQEEAVSALQHSQQMRAEKLARLSEAQERYRQAEAELGELARQEGSLLGRIAEYRKVLAQKEDIVRALEEYQAAFAANQRLNDVLQELLRLREEEGRFERTIEAARSQLVAEDLFLQREVARLKEVATRRGGLQETMKATQGELAKWSAKEVELADWRTQLEGLSQRLGILQHMNQEITLQGQELRAKVEQLSRPGATGVCPLCGSELGPEGHRRILEEYQQELERQRELYRANERALRDLQEEQKRCQAEARALEEAIQSGRTSAQTKLVTATQALAEAEKAAADLASSERRLAQVQEVLVAQGYEPEAQHALSEIRHRAAALDYDQGKHQDLQRRLRELEPWLIQAQQLQEAERRLPQEEADLARVGEALARWQGRLSEESERSATLAKELAAQPDATQELARAQQERATIQERLTQTSTALGRVQAQLERCRDLEGQLRGRRQETVAKEQDKGLYEELVLAFGRRGVQALLIETALPELEEEANRLLSRMTDNRMHLTLETQRQARSGALMETLDIKIADELGVRGYELYSGGEAFRINFALRIAISKLLARRAGAPLPTLVIDEGFGTQDAAGREKLIEAVNAIADDFQRVLVITHIDELKDAFPVRIEVTKTAEGSRVAVV